MPVIVDKRRRITDAKKVILAQLVDVDKDRLESKINELLPRLSGWDYKRVLTYVRNNLKRDVSDAR